MKPSKCPAIEKKNEVRKGNKEGSSIAFYSKTLTRKSLDWLKNAFFGKISWSKWVKLHLLPFFKVDKVIFQKMKNSLQTYFNFSFKVWITPIQI